MCAEQAKSFCDFVSVEHK